MKVLLKKIISFLQSILGASGWSFEIVRTRPQKKWKTAYIPSIKVFMRLDLSESLDISYASGSVDELNIAFMNSVLNNDSVFVDVGANQGFYSLFVLKAFPGAQVVAIEPDPYAVSKLQKNLELNNLQNSNIQIIQSAASLSDEFIELMINDAGNRAGSSLVIDRRMYTGKVENTTVEVRGEPLFEILKRSNIQRVSCMKLDIEGYELPVLEKYFENAPLQMWPNHLLVEAIGTSIKTVGGSPISLMFKQGYNLVNHDTYNYIFSNSRI